MLNPEQNKLVIQAIKDKKDNYAELIRKENAKPYPNSLTLRNLGEIQDKYNLILDVIHERGL